MKKIAGYIVFTAFVLALAGCGGDEAVKPDAPVEDRGGAQTTGTGEGAAGTGEAVGAQDLLSERRIHFAFDSSAVDAEYAAIVEAHAAYLVDHAGLNVTLEGHTDERGTREYNLALGERRAAAVARMMRALGVAGNRIQTTTYGEENPIAPEHNESAWRENRRVEISY